MKCTTPSAILTAMLAIGALGAAAGAHAFSPVKVQVQQHSVQVPATYVWHPASHEAQDNRYGRADEGRYRHERGGRDRCGAPRWQPELRYLPGHVVWRKGDLFIARRVSARVWNVNSPPEWTPNYWAPAVCR